MERIYLNQGQERGNSALASSRLERFGYLNQTQSHGVEFNASVASGQLWPSTIHMKHLIILIVIFFFFTPGLAQQTTELQVNPDALNFIVMGDWGRNGEDHQKQVAQRMGEAAAKASVDFIISTGDNFYPKGVVSVADPLWKYSFEDIYTAFSLQWDWYPVLGNHDYGANPGAQIEYSKISRRWKMPGRYYKRQFRLGNDSTNQVLFLFVDTTPLIRGYYSNDAHAVHDQDSLAQQQWIEKTLSSTGRNAKWKFVVGHHPMYTGGGRTESRDTKDIRRILEPMLTRHDVDAYLAGHEHSLQHIVHENGLNHFVSGAASEVTPVKYLKDTKFAKSDYGFMLFSVTKDSTLVQVVNHEGKVLYKYNLLP
jgi:tartrate-resistant acid phosphatase type 5